jgi:hypothetical protein
VTAVAFVAGLFVGGFLGAIAVALCTAAGREGERDGRSPDQP